MAAISYVVVMEAIMYFIFVMNHASIQVYNNSHLALLSIQITLLVLPLVTIPSSIDVIISPATTSMQNSENNNYSRILQYPFLCISGATAAYIELTSMTSQYPSRTYVNTYGDESLSTATSTSWYSLHATPTPFPRSSGGGKN